jgi:MarR family transcriptional regulator for hemolysin
VIAINFGQNDVMKNEKDIHPDAAVAPSYLAKHAERVFHRAVEATLRSRGTSLTLIGPLLWLSWRGPMLQRDLVKASAVKQPAMVATLDKLEAAGLVEREVVATNKRAALVSITSRGRDTAALGRQVLLDTNAQGMNGFTPEETATLVALLQRFIANLEA